MRKLIYAAVFCSALAAGSSLAGGGKQCSGYVAHEWGTFTSVQAADGVQLPWNPLTTAELPDFVYSLAWPEGKNARRPNLLAGKAALFALQRMETPVIYFYADQPQTVNVTVNFPKGRVTEWYPQATTVNPFGEPEMVKNRAEDGVVSWNKVAILPKTDAGTACNDSSGSHYYAAREAEANTIRLNTPTGSETEKFLFYRGVGSFEAPLKVTQSGDDGEQIELRNSGTQELRSLFVYRVVGDRAAWTLLAKLKPAEALKVHLNFAGTFTSRSQFAEDVTSRLKDELVKEGLFAPEAAAMVKTWNDSWFAEQGVRVLYLLPRQWTDETLPLTLSPAAREVARVMVGRAELITPAMQRGLFQEMLRYASNNQQARAQAVEKVRQMKMGRFGEAVLRRVLSRAPMTREFNNSSWELLQAAAKPAEEKRLAQK